MQKTYLLHPETNNFDKNAYLLFCFLKRQTVIEVWLCTYQLKPQPLPYPGTGWKFALREPQMQGNPHPPWALFGVSIGDFRVAFCLCFKVRPSAKPFTWKLVLFRCKFWFIYIWIRLISIYMEGFALGLALKQRLKTTQKSPIDKYISFRVIGLGLEGYTCMDTIFYVSLQTKRYHHTSTVK